MKKDDIALVLSDDEYFDLSNSIMFIGECLRNGDQKAALAQIESIREVLYAERINNSTSRYEGDSISDRIRRRLAIRAGI